jgi:hypothetical protein
MNSWGCKWSGIIIPSNHAGYRESSNMQCIRSYVGCDHTQKVLVWPPTKLHKTALTKLKVLVSIPGVGSLATLLFVAGYSGKTLTRWLISHVVFSRTEVTTTMTEVERFGHSFLTVTKISNRVETVVLPFRIRPCGIGPFNIQCVDLFTVIECSTVHRRFVRITGRNKMTEVLFPIFVLREHDWDIVSNQSRVQVLRESLR